MPMACNPPLQLVNFSSNYSSNTLSALQIQLGFPSLPTSVYTFENPSFSFIFPQAFFFFCSHPHPSDLPSTVCVHFAQVNALVSLITDVIGLLPPYRPRTLQTLVFARCMLRLSNSPPGVTKRPHLQPPIHAG